MTSQIEEDITQEESVGELLERLEKERRAKEASARAAKELLTRSAEEVIKIDSQDSQGKVVVEPPNPGPFGEPVPPDVTIDEAKNPTVTPTGSSAEDLEKLKLAAHRLRGLKAVETRKKNEAKKATVITAAVQAPKPVERSAKTKDYSLLIETLRAKLPDILAEHETKLAALQAEYEDKVAPFIEEIERLSSW